MTRTYKYQVIAKMEEMGIEYIETLEKGWFMYGLEHKYGWHTRSNAQHTMYDTWGETLAEVMDTLDYIEDEQAYAAEQQAAWEADIS
jgi:hypothetical protein